MPVDVIYKYTVTTKTPSVADDGSRTWKTESAEYSADGTAYDFSAAAGAALVHFAAGTEFRYAKPVMSADESGFRYDTGAVECAVSSAAECWMTVPVRAVSVK